MTLDDLLEELERLPRSARTAGVQLEYGEEQVEPLSIRYELGVVIIHSDYVDLAGIDFADDTNDY